MELPPACLVILLTLLLFALVLHLAGIYCLNQEKSKLKKQKIILLNLSVVEISIIVFTLGHLSCAHSEIKNEDLEKVNQVLCVLYHSLTSLLYSSMALIPIDRLLCVIAPHMYHVYVRRSTLKKVVCGIWVLSLTWPIPFCFTSTEVHTNVIQSFAYGAQGLFVVISFCAYSLIIRSLSRRQLMLSSGAKDKDSMKRTLFVSFSVTLSFVMLYIIPNCVPHSSNVVVETICIALTYCGLAIDPVIYVLLHSALRPIAYRLLTCKGKLRTWGTMENINNRNNGMVKIAGTNDANDFPQEVNKVTKANIACNNVPNGEGIAGDIESIEMKLIGRNYPRNHFVEMILNPAISTRGTGKESVPIPLWKETTV